MADFIVGAKERLDDLQYNGMHILQRVDKYCFTSDAVVLANAVKGAKGKVVVDLGAGSGVISLLVAAKQFPKHVYAVELQPVMADLARRNVAGNSLDDVIEVLEIPMQKSLDYIPRESVDVVVCNPPYSRMCDRETQEDEEIAICRHEMAVTMHEVVATSNALLRYGGYLYIMYKAERLQELLDELLAVNIPAKTLYLLNVKNRIVDAVIVVAKKGGSKLGMSVLLA